MTDAEPQLPGVRMRLGRRCVSCPASRPWYGMHMFTERTQVLLSREQVARLRRAARRDRRSLGAVIRDAVDAYTLGTAARRRDAIRHLVGLEAPVNDWDVLKAEIISGATAGQ